jgi:arylsulfatase A-like enzyme
VRARSATVIRARLGALAALLLVIATLLPGGEATGSHDARPNILIIMTDDQRAHGTLRVMPRTREWFGEGGTTFTNAWVTTPLCCPSRSTIFTGRYAHNHGVLTNEHALELDQSTTVQARLRAAGYTTAFLGKYLNDWGFRENPPAEFDRWATFLGGYYNERFNVDGDIIQFPGYTTSFLKDQAMRVIEDFEAEDDAPWLMYVAPSAPHSPYTPARRYADADVGAEHANPATRESDLSDKPSFVQGADKGALTQVVHPNQLRTLMSVDRLVHRVMTKLEELEESEDTLAIFMSDNGFLWGEHDLIQKRSPYTPALRVPLMVRWPGHVSPGSTDDSNVATVDIAPTVYEATEVEANGLVDGRSLFGTGEREEMFFEHWAEPERQVPTYSSLRTDEFQYTEYYLDQGVQPAFQEYYDLVADPWQLDNLLANGDPTDDPSPESLAETRTRIHLYKRCSGVTCP